MINLQARRLVYYSTKKNQNRYGTFHKGDKTK